MAAENVVDPIAVLHSTNKPSCVNAGETMILRGRESRVPYYFELVAMTGFPSLDEFIRNSSLERKFEICRAFLSKGKQLPNPSIPPLDGICRPTKPERSRLEALIWSSLTTKSGGLQPYLADADRNPLTAGLGKMDKIAMYVASRWAHQPHQDHGLSPFLEVAYRTIEGSYRSLRGTGFEDLIRSAVEQIVEANALPFLVSSREIQIPKPGGGKSDRLDIVLTSSRNRRAELLIPCKWSDRPGAKHSDLFCGSVANSLRDLGIPSANVLTVFGGRGWEKAARKYNLNYLVLDADFSSDEEFAKLTSELILETGFFDTYSQADVSNAA